MKPATSIYPPVFAITFALLLTTCGGCDEQKAGPKRADDKAAHTARYHPDIPLSQPSPDSRPSSSEPFTMTMPSEPGAEGNGSPVLFVINQSIAVQEVLEPTLPELQDLAASSTSEREYYRAISKIIGEEIRHQASTIVIYAQAKKKVTDSVDEQLGKEADKAIQKFVNARFGSAKARYEAYLKNLGLTMKDVKERTKRQLLVSDFLRQRFEPLISAPPRRDLLNYYNAHVNQFTTPAKAELQMIEIPLTTELGKPVSAATEQEIAEARARAREELRRAREEIDSGVEFTAIARRYSRGAQRANGGSWGEISPGSLAGGWAKAGEILFSLADGQISGIIETEEASFIIRCANKVLETRLTFEEAQTKIVERVRDEEYGRLTTRYIGDLLKNAAIDEQQQQAFFVAVMTAAPRFNPKPAAPVTENHPNK